MSQTKFVRAAFAAALLALPLGAHAAQTTDNTTNTPKDAGTLGLQVALDRAGFSPGVIDGKMGRLTTQAIKGFQEAKGLEVTGTLDMATEAALGDLSMATRTVTISDADAAGPFVTEIPESMAEKAKLEGLHYTSVEEALAEKYHTTPARLRELNPGGEFTPGSQIIVPAVGAEPRTTLGANYPRPLSTPAPITRAPRPQTIAAPATNAAKPNTPAARGPAMMPKTNAQPSAADAKWDATLASLSVAKAQPSAAKVVVDKSDKHVRAYDSGGKLLAQFPATIGSEHDPLPLGDWKIDGISKLPPFNYNPDLFWDAEPGDKKETLPPGPNGPVGVVWLDLSKEHYGIHGTPEPQTISRTQSHGCIRLTNWDAARLAQMVRAGTPAILQE
jgi:lipoprotein-anchoring transpeptidase ErfK/SrfK